MSPTRRSFLHLVAGGAISLATGASDGAVQAQPLAPIARIGLFQGIDRDTYEYRGASMTIDIEAGGATVTMAAPGGGWDRASIESQDPAVIAFLSQFAKLLHLRPGHEVAS